MLKSVILICAIALVAAGPASPETIKNAPAPPAPAAPKAAAPAPAPPKAAAPAPVPAPPAPVAAPPPPPPTPAPVVAPRVKDPRGIQIISATYANWDEDQTESIKKDNALPHARDTCDGLLSCDYTPDFRTIGDDHPGRTKGLDLKYKCGTSSTVKEVYHGSHPAGGDAHMKVFSLNCGHSEL